MNHGLCPADIQIDLIGDIRDHCRERLILARYPQHSVDRVARDPHRLISYYFGVFRRVISHQPRRIHKSNRFSCPERHLGALAKIEELIVTGGDLTPYLSDDIMELKNVDAMLNVFGVHHLHLGDSIITKGKKRGFTKRTPPLLYCYFTGTNAYFIDVMDHESFGSQTVIQIVHENWTDLLSQYRMPGIVLYPQLSDEQTFALSRAGYSTPISMGDGTVYMPPGGGVMWSRDNADDIMKTNRLLNRLHEIQTSIVQFIDREEDRRVSRYTFPIRLRLRILDNEYCVEEVETGDLYWIAEYGVVRMNGELSRTSK